MVTRDLRSFHLGTKYYSETAVFESSPLRCVTRPASLILLSWLLLGDVVEAVELISKVEAGLPTLSGAIAVDRRGILRAPKVEIVSPDQTVNSPILFQVRFASFGGTKIDLETVKVTFLRTPNVDLTPRLKPFIQADGIKMPEAELPPGEYALRVDVRDTDGRLGTTTFVLSIAP